MRLAILIVIPIALTMGLIALATRAPAAPVKCQPIGTLTWLQLCGGR